MSMNCFEGVVIPECDGAKYIMKNNNRVTQYHDGRLMYFNTCIAARAIDGSQECIIANSKYLVDSAITMMLFLIDMGGETLVSMLSKNQMLGLSALRCAMLNGLVNTSDLLAAAFLVAKQSEIIGLDLNQYLQEYTIDYVYPYYCTCQADVRNLKDMLKMALSFGVAVEPYQFAPCGGPA